MMDVILTQRRMTLKAKKMFEAPNGFKREYAHGVLFTENLLTSLTTVKEELQEILDELFPNDSESYYVTSRAVRFLNSEDAMLLYLKVS